MEYRRPFVYRGRYINLDRSPQRRAGIEESLRRAGLADRYVRFAGVEGTTAKQSRTTSLAAGYLGNWLSHEGVLSEHLAADPDAHLHILEDDALLPSNAAELFDQVLKRVEDELTGGWDVLFTDTTPSIETRAYVALAEHVLTYRPGKPIALVSLESIDFAGMASLFVNRRSLDKYASMIRGNWSICQPIDLFLREQVHSGNLRAYVTAPFLTSISDVSSQSEVLGAHDFSREVADLYRRSFYVAADLPNLLARMTELARHARLPTLSSLFITAHAAALSDRWNTF
jgi:GR25 family glycosyltransferase involved in LPS biosynthesis